MNTKEFQLVSTKAELKRSLRNIKEALAIIEASIESDDNRFIEMELRRIENSAKSIRRNQPQF